MYRGYRQPCNIKKTRQQGLQHLSLQNTPRKRRRASVGKFFIILLAMVLRLGLKVILGVARDRHAALVVSLAFHGLFFSFFR